MAIPTPSTTGTSLLRRVHSDPTRLSASLLLHFRPHRRPRLAVFSSSNPSSSGGANGSVGDPSEEEKLHHGLPPPPPWPGRRGAPVFVTLPLDAVAPTTGRVARRKTMAASFVALAAAGVEGIAVEVWWGVVEREAPRAYDWAGYVDLVAMARGHGLKVRAVIAFHQCGSGPGDPCWIPLPKWALEEIDRDPDLAYADRFGRRNREYISLGCDIVPVLKGRSPMQAYSDFMRNFRDTFREFLGVVITEIQVGMGPAGELRYPSSPSEKLIRPGSIHEHGEFQCYDKYMLASLNACAQNIGMNEWGNSGPLDAGRSDSEETSFFRSDGSWNTAYGHFFLEWYSGMLLLHGERLCMAADAIFCGTGVNILAKVAGIYWHFGTNAHPSELTAGYYNTLMRDGYLPIACVLSRYRMTLCCTCFDMQDAEEGQMNPKSSPEGFLRQLVYAARMYKLPLAGENSVTRLDDTSIRQVIKSSKLYTDSVYDRSLSFNFMRMNKNLFDRHNWTHFTRLVRQMSDPRTFQAKLDFGRGELCFASPTAVEEVRRALTCF